MTRLQTMIFLVSILVILWSLSVPPIEHFVNHSGWYTDEQCRYQQIEVLKNMIKANNLNKGSEDSWSVYLPCGYNYPQRELDKLKPTSPEQKIFIIKGCDNLSRKDTLWEQLKQKYGVLASTKLMPRTFLLTSSPDLAQFKKEYSPHKVYIMKKNIQRQEGLKITKNAGEILSGLSQGYVIAQEMLQDPYLIEGRKTNCRIYLLIVCQNNVKKAYIYLDGFMYYTPKPFRPNSMDRDEVITTGYIDRSVYVRNPLTLQDFATYLTRRGHQGQTIFTKVGSMLSKVLDAASPNFCTRSHVSQQTTFQLFGCDVAFNNKLDVHLIEINKGPDLGGKDTRDKQLKQDMVNGLFKLIGVGQPVTDIKVGQSAHNFLRVW